MTGEAVHRTVRKAREPDPRDAEDCPITALGQRAGTYYFLSAAGEIRDLKARDLTLLNMVSLFNGDPAWLEDNYAKVDRREKKTGEIDIAAAAAALMRRCAEVGLYRLDTPRRLVGVWREAAAVIAHCGDQLVIYESGRRRRAAAGRHHGGALYLGEIGRASCRERV